MLALIALGGLIMVFCQWSPPALALDPSLDITQYAHTAWTFHNGSLCAKMNETSALT